MLVFIDPVTGKAYDDGKPFRERYWADDQRLKLRYRESHAAKRPH